MFLKKLKFSIKLKMTFEKVLITLLSLPYYAARAMFPIPDDDEELYEDAVTISL